MNLAAAAPATRRLAAAACALMLGGCTAIGLTEPPLQPVAIQTLEYYPFQVKGYQNSYPRRSILVLAPVDARTLDGGATRNGAAPAGRVAIGVVRGQGGQVLQRVYGDPVVGSIQRAIVRSAQEAGLTARGSPESEYDAVRSEQSDDYVLASKITSCWVDKRRTADTRFGPLWRTAADVALEVTVYKPPFTVPFWQGSSSATYNDPPISTFAPGIGDEAGIYDEPGQVLSVALTRAVAGIFDRNDLRTLIAEDVVRPR
jgi:hypothetical protein